LPRRPLQEHEALCPEPRQCASRRHTSLCLQPPIVNMALHFCNEIATLGPPPRTKKGRAPR